MLADGSIESDRLFLESERFTKRDLRYEPHRQINMTRGELNEIKAFFRERWALAQRMKAEAERAYRGKHGLREPTAKDIALWEQGKARKGAGWDNDDGIAWNYPPETYARMNEVCFTRVPKRIWNILGRPDNLYEKDEEYLQIAFNPKF